MPRTLSPRRIFQCLMSFSAAFHPIPASQLAARRGLARFGWEGRGGEREWMERDGGARGRGWPEEENHLGWA